MKNDIYEQEVKRLTGKSDYVIHQAWLQQRPLFRIIGKTEHDRNLDNCGCLTLIRFNNGDANCAIVDGKVDKKLTNAIRKDTKLPRMSSEINDKNIKHFAEWQRRIDKYYLTGKLEL